MRISLKSRLPDSESAIRSTVLSFWVFPELALRPFRQKWAGWASECSEWISGNSHQSAPHWAPRRASYRHVPLQTIPCMCHVDLVRCQVDFLVVVLWHLLTHQVSVVDLYRCSPELSFHHSLPDFRHLGRRFSIPTPGSTAFCTHFLCFVDHKSCLIYICASSCWNCCHSCCSKAV